MKIETIRIRGIEIGAGMPKICVPVMAGTKGEILEGVRSAAAQKPDCIELRIDGYENIEDSEQILQMLKDIRNIAGGNLLLFTFRSRAEGGKQELSIDAYEKLLGQVCASGSVDLIDVEAYMQEGLLGRMCETAHRNNVYVVASNHDFFVTPEETDITARLEYMDKMGADIPKIAVMAKSERDVLRLLAATVSYRERGGTRPVITMSMNALGGITRLSGEVFGSAMTFAALGQESAPGQLALSETRKVLEIIHKSLA